MNCLTKHLHGFIIAGFTQPNRGMKLSSRVLHMVNNHRHLTLAGSMLSLPGAGHEGDFVC